MIAMLAFAVGIGDSINVVFWMIMLPFVVLFLMTMSFLAGKA